MIKFAFERLKIHRGTILIIAFCSVMISVTDFMIPFLTAKFIDEILIARNVAAFYNFILLMTVIMTAAIISHYASLILSKKILLATSNNLVEEILRHVQSLAGERLLKSDMVYLAKRIDTDATDFVAFIVESMIEICLNVVQLLIAIFLLFGLGGKWLLIFFIVAALHFITYKILRGKLFERSIAVRESNSKYFTALTDNFVYAWSIKLHCLHEKYLAAFKARFAEYFAAALREMKINFWFKYTDMNSGDLFRILVFLLGGLDVLGGAMTIGNLVALIGYYGLAIQAVAYFMNFGQGWQNALASYERLLEIKNIPADKDGNLKLNGVDCVEVRGLNFSIDGREIIKNFSRQFKRGKIYCIVGKNGAGKTTLINFLCGMFKTVDASINYNGIPIKCVDMIHARKNFIAVVEQKEFIRNDDLSGGERRKERISRALTKKTTC